MLLVFPLLSHAQCPVITAQPVDVSICSGGDATFWIEATGNIASYQWFKMNEAVPGANGPYLTITSASVADSDWYRCEVYPPDETCEVITSGSVSLSVAEPTSVAAGSDIVSICEGESFTFTAYATGTSLEYQWYRNGELVGDATGPTIVVSNAVLSDAGTYHCTVSSPMCPPVNSDGNVAMVTLTTAINQHPQGGDYCLNDPISMTVNAQGSNLSYLWYKDDQEIPGSTEPYFYSNSAFWSDAGSYTCVVTGTCGVVTSAPAIVTVDCLGADGAEAGKTRVWPVPADDVLNLDLRDMAETTGVTLIDIRGRHCARWQVQQTAALDVSGITPGVYILQLSGGNRQENRRILIE